MTFACLLIFAMLLDRIFGEPIWLWSRVPHPAVLMGRIVGWCDVTLNHGPVRRLKGLVVITLLVMAGLAIGWFLSLFGPLAEIIIAAVLLAQKSLVDHVKDVASGLRMSVRQGQRMVARIVSRDTAEMDQSRIARATIESAAENLSDGVIAPAFWFLIAGLPGMVAYKFINTADSMIGYRTEKYSDFGWAAARLDDLVNWIPARLTAVLIAVPAGVFDRKSIQSDAALHRSPNAGWPEAAMARALNVALAGPRAYDGVMQQFSWVNPDGQRYLSAQNIDDAVQMLWNAWTFALCLVVILALVF